MTRSSRGFGWDRVLPPALMLAVFAAPAAAQQLASISITATTREVHWIASPPGPSRTQAFDIPGAGWLRIVYEADPKPPAPFNGGGLTWSNHGQTTEFAAPGRDCQTLEEPSPPVTGARFRRTVQCWVGRMGGVVVMLRPYVQTTWTEGGSQAAGAQTVTVAFVGGSANSPPALGSGGGSGTTGGSGGSGTTGGSGGSGGTGTSGGSGGTTTGGQGPTGGGGVGPGGGVLDGDWNWNGNHHTGQIRFAGNTAQLRWGDGKVEQLKNLTFDAASGRVSYYRDIGEQPYTGLLAGDEIQGTFTQYGRTSDAYLWCAARRGACVLGKKPTPPTPPTPSPTTPTTPPPSEPVRTDRLTLQVGSRHVASGDTVTVPVWLINAARVANMNVAITYQARSVATSGSVVKGNLLDRALFEANAGERGTVYIGFVLKDGVTGTGTVAQIPFTATGAAGSRVPLEVRVTSINGADGQRLDIATVNGMLDIVGPPADPTKPGDPRPPKEPPGVPGDADGDGTLTAGDALLALKMSVRLIPVRMTADMDRDGQVTANDARLILVQVVGK